MATPWESLFRVYEKMPAGVRKRLTVFVSDPRTLRGFFLYVCIGFTGVTVYFGLLWIFLRANLPALTATAASFLIGASLQFLLNRYLNFRAFDRTITRQASTGLAVITLNFLLTLAIVAFAVHALHMSAFLANIATIPVTLPVAYLATRYMTFGPGIRARLHQSDATGFLKGKIAHINLGELLFSQCEALVFGLIGGVPGILGFALRSAAFKLFFQNLGGFCWVQHGVTIVSANRLRVGKHFGCNTGSYINAVGEITIGDYVLIGSNVTLSSGMHPIEGRMPPVFARPTIPKPIHIEDDVWIGAGAVILPGVILRRGSVIGANAVVTRDTQEYSVNVGIPAKMIRFRDPA
jgi:acetyltransferase-like isoleucine patch superfamily enzyme/putative flippase GtrA